MIINMSWLLFNDYYLKIILFYFLFKTTIRL